MDSGHIRPLRALAQNLRQIGYPVTFITGHTFQKSIEAIEGVEFVGLKGEADFLDASKVPQGASPVSIVLNAMGPQALDGQYTALQETINRMTLLHKKIIVIAELYFFGTMPLLLGSPATVRVPCICLSSTPLCILSKNVAPWRLGLPPQSTEVNIELNTDVIKVMASFQEELERKLEPYQCTVPFPSRHPIDWHSRIQDVFYQLTPPSMEWPRTDLPKNVSFIGCLQGGNDKHPLPEWFQTFVVENEVDLPLVAVTAGTFRVNIHELLIPTIEACRALPVRLVILSGPSSIPSDYILPENARHAEWIAYDQLLPYVSIVVSNGGYNGICQSLSAGVPMVLAGTDGDKIEGGSRAEMTGAAIYLRTHYPSVEQIQEALERILREKGFKEAAMRMKEDFSKMDAVGSVLKGIDELMEKLYPSQFEE